MIVTVEQLVEVLDRREKGSRKSFSISKINQSKIDNIFSEMGLRIDIDEYSGAAPSETERIPGYAWTKMNEDDVDQRAGYMSYLQKYLGSRLPGSFRLFDVAGSNNLLTLKDLRLPFNLTGGTDVLISQGPIKRYAILKTAFVLELKKSVTDDSWPQAVAELIAADLKAQHYPVITILTDLNDNWDFFWFSECKVIRILNLQQPKAAFDFIEQVLAQIVQKQENAPIPLLGRPVKRMKVTDACPPVIDASLAEQYENLEMLKGDFANDENELGGIEQQQHDIMRRVVLSNPIFHSMYS